MRKSKLPRIGFSILIIMLTANISSAQNLIAIQNGNIHSFYTTLDSAITHSNNGDTIYLSGGSFTLSSTINKSLCIIGAGYFADSSIATGISLLNGITLKKGADNGSLEGVYINGTIKFGEGDTSESYINNYKINRCYINGNIQFINSQGPNLSNNISVSECILMGAINYGNGIPTGFVAVSNSLVGGVIQGLNQSLIQNNIFLFNQQFYNGLAVNGTSNCIIRNNIFFMNHYMNGTNNLFYNNIGIWNNGVYTGTYANNAFGIGNVIEIWDSTFINSNSNNPFNYPNNNFHLKNNSVGINAGTDGLDIGIYGGLYPWKEGAVPSNPHIQFKSISNATNPNGNLPINIKVVAQDH